MNDFPEAYAREHKVYPEIVNLFEYYAGRYALEHDHASEPECLFRARSRAYALEHLPLTLPSGQEFLGGLGFYTIRMPEDGVPPPVSELEKAYEKFAAHPYRPFQAGANHTIPDYRTLMDEGIPGFEARAEAEYRRDPTPYRESMLIALRSFRNCMKRASQVLRTSAPESAARLAALAVRKPETFEEGLQLMILVHTVLWMDGGGADALGRVDQYLYPLYLASRPSDDEAVSALCQAFTLLESWHGIYSIANICIGGQTPDGRNAENELSHLIIKAVGKVHTPGTNLSARLYDGTSDEFLYSCVDLISTGIGFPSVFNDHINIPMLENNGIPPEAARDYGLVGCVECVVPGRQIPWSDGRFNLTKVFTETMHCLPSFESFDCLMAELREKTSAEARKYAEAFEENLSKYPADQYPMPFLSALTRDCIARGRDLNDGGSEFPRFHGVGMVGFATLVDSLAAVKKLVFEEKRISASELADALDTNFKDREILRQTLLNCAPKYGNDDPYVDSLAAEVVKLCSASWDGIRISDGGRFLSCMASNISNVPCGAETPATPDGRLAGTPLSDAASPSCGRDRSGSTAFVNSITSPDYSAQNCTVVNMRFLPDMFRGAEGRARMVALLRKFIAGRGHEMQFNVTDNGLLEKAMENPGDYADLIVRVSGFSGYFTRLDKEVQKDIIRRNIHGS